MVFTFERAGLICQDLTKSNSVYLFFPHVIQPPCGWRVLAHLRHTSLSRYNEDESKAVREYRPPKRISLRSRKISKSGRPPLSSRKNKRRSGRLSKPRSLPVGVDGRLRTRFLNRPKPSGRNTAPLRRWIVDRKASRRWTGAERPSSRPHPLPEAR